MVSNFLCFSNLTDIFSLFLDCLFMRVPIVALLISIVHKTVLFLPSHIHNIHIIWIIENWGAVLHVRNLPSIQLSFHAVTFSVPNALLK